MTAYLYLFGNRLVSSDFPIPNLPPAESSAQPDLHVLVPMQVDRLASPGQWDCQWPDKAGNPGFLITKERDEGGHVIHLAQFPGLCDYRLDLGRRQISITHLPGVSADAIEHLLIDQTLPCALAGLGDMVLHCACIAMGDGCVLLLGKSGWGKSTLTGLLQRRGHAPYSDDCAVLLADGGETRALPTYPSLRLYDDSIREAFEYSPQLRPVAEYTNKRRLPLEEPKPPDSRPPKVRAIYVLNDPAVPQDKVTVESMARTAACMALIQHTFRLDLRDRGRHAIFLGQAARIAQQVPVFAFGYPRDFARSLETIDALLQHVKAPPAARISPLATSNKPAAEAQ